MSVLADASKGSSCSQELAEWNKVNVQLGGMTLSAQVNVSSATAAEQKQVQDIGVDIKALQKEPCSMQVVLLPFGEKDEPLLFSGSQSSNRLLTHLTARWRARSLTLLLARSLARSLTHSLTHTLVYALVRSAPPPPPPPPPRTHPPICLCTSCVSIHLKLQPSTALELLDPTGCCIAYCDKCIRNPYCPCSLPCQG